MDALLFGVGGAVDGDLVAVVAFDGVGVIDGPNRLLALVDEDWRHAAFDAFLDAGRAGSSMLGTAHGIGDPASDGGRVGCTRGNRARRRKKHEESNALFHLRPPGTLFVPGVHDAPPSARWTRDLWLKCRPDEGQEGQTSALLHCIPTLFDILEDDLESRGGGGIPVH